MRRLRTIGLFLVMAGLVITLTSTVLPLVKMPQTLFKRGPTVELNENVTYWIDTWILPPIDAGTQVSVDLEAGSPGNISIAILPSQGGVVTSGSPLLIYVFDPTRQKFSANETAPVTSEYLVFISCIKNNFTLTIKSRWSPFYSLRTFVYLGLGALPAGLLIIYYDRILENKERLIRESLKVNSREINIHNS
jgi:hypothetical protein